MSKRDELIRFAKATAEAELLLSTCGNASLRLAGQEMLITGAGSELGCLQLQEVSQISLADGSLLEGPRSSTETELHRQVYLRRPEVEAVLHWQSPWATLMGCMVDPPPLGHIPEYWAYIGQYASVPYACPGSHSLVELVAKAVQDPKVTVIQLCNHGQLAMGRCWKELLRKAIFFERSCWLALQGKDLKLIPPEEAALLCWDAPSGNHHVTRV